VVLKATERIFVFGSNLAGRHGAGAAKRAYEHYGALWGCGYGLWGQSYALPTKDRRIMTLPLPSIHEYVKKFLRYAAADKNEFNVTQVGCGLAGLQHSDIAPMFRPISNVWYDRAWEQWLGADAQFWTDEIEVL
jgi:hypothetical protein